MFPGSHHYAHYDEKNNEVLLENLLMKPVVLLPFPLSVKNNGEQYANDEYSRHYNLPYRVYVPDDMVLPDII